MIKDIEVNNLKKCNCGQEIKSYSVAYGSTPYDIFCPNCKKQTNHSAFLTTGSPDNIISLWNDHCADMTIEEIEKEYIQFKKIQKMKKEEGWRIYLYFWISEKGKFISKSC